MGVRKLKTGRSKLRLNRTQASLGGREANLRNSIPTRQETKKDNPTLQELREIPEALRSDIIQTPIHLLEDHHSSLIFTIRNMIKTVDIGPVGGMLLLEKLGLVAQKDQSWTMGVINSDTRIILARTANQLERELWADKRRRAGISQLFEITQLLEIPLILSQDHCRGLVFTMEGLIRMGDVEPVGANLLLKEIAGILEKKVKNSNQIHCGLNNISCDDRILLTRKANYLEKVFGAARDAREQEKKLEREQEKKLEREQKRD